MSRGQKKKKIEILKLTSEIKRILDSPFDSLYLHVVFLRFLRNTQGTNKAFNWFFSFKFMWFYCHNFIFFHQCFSYRNRIIRFIIILIIILFYRISNINLEIKKIFLLMWNNEYQKQNVIFISAYCRKKKHHWYFLFFLLCLNHFFFTWIFYSLSLLHFIWK